MPLDATGLAWELNEDEARDLAVLRAARNVIKHRWIGGMALRTTAPFKGQVCALRAVFAVGCQTPGDYQSVAGRLKAALPWPFMCVPEYNDAKSTTHQDVLDLFDRAIVAIERP